MKPAELFNVSTVKKASGGDRAPCVPAKKKPITAASDVQLKVLKNVILKRRPRAKGARSESAGEEDSDAGTTETGPNHKKPRVDV